MSEILSDVTDFIIDTKHKTPKFVDHGYLCIRTPNIGRGFFILENAKYVSQETYEEWTERATPRTGDLILAREAPIGNVAWIPPGLKPCIGQRTILIRPLHDRVDGRYLSYLLLGDECQNRMHALSGGATVPHLNMSDIRKLDLPHLPDFSVQQKISAILSAYDDLIEKNLRRIKILEEMAQNLYREWFVKFRFPGHEHARLVDSPLGKIPKGWVAATLSDLVSIRKGKNITKKTIVPGNVPVVAGGITPAYYHNAANTQNPVITISASGANAGFVNLYYEDVWASDCSVIDSGVTRHVYYFNLLLKERQYEVTRLQRGAAQPHVYPKDLMALEVCAAPDEVLEMFGSYIEPVFKMIRNLKSRNNNLRQTRDLLLPKLISGELDVSESDIDIRGTQ